MSRSTALRAAAGLALCLVATAAPAAKGRLGFSVDIETSGFVLTPSLERVSIRQVMPGSPAEAAGLHAGDEVVLVDGAAVKGAPARPLGAKLQSLEPGQHLRMTVRRGDGRVIALDLVAGR